jgi:hypothetical protein
MADIFYVYEYLNDDGTPYYIGKGKGNRIHDSHNNVIVPPLEKRRFIKTNLNESDALSLEISLIRKYGRKIDGGTLDNTKLNQWACTSGWTHKEETRQKISEANTGKVRTEKQRDNYRKPKSAEHAERIRKARIGQKRSSETKQKISKKLLGNIPWNKGKTNGTWSESRRNAYLKNKALKHDAE